MTLALGLPMAWYLSLSQPHQRFAWIWRLYLRSASPRFSSRHRVERSWRRWWRSPSSVDAGAFAPADQGRAVRLLRRDALRRDSVRTRSVLGTHCNHPSRRRRGLFRWPWFHLDGGLEVAQEHPIAGVGAGAYGAALSSRSSRWACCCFRVPCPFVRGAGEARAPGQRSCCGDSFRSRCGIAPAAPRWPPIRFRRWLAQLRHAVRTVSRRPHRLLLAGYWELLYRALCSAHRSPGYYLWTRSAAACVALRMATGQDRRGHADHARWHRGSRGGPGGAARAVWLRQRRRFLQPASCGGRDHHRRSSCGTNSVSPAPLAA